MHPVPAWHSIPFRPPRGGRIRMFERRLHLGVGSPRPGRHVPSPARELASLHSSRNALVAEIERASERLGLDGALGVAVARVESGLDPRARSPDGRSRGLFQLLEGTRGEMRRRLATGRIQRASSVEAVALGVGYLRYLHDLFARRAELGGGLRTHPVRDAGERRRFAVAAFNAGEGRVAEAQRLALRAGKNPARFADIEPYLPPITRRYVSKVIAAAGFRPRGGLLGEA